MLLPSLLLPSETGVIFLGFFNHIIIKFNEQ